MSADVTEERLKRIAAILDELEVRKALYAELDAICLALQAEGFQSATTGGQTFTLVDNFAEKNTVFRPAGVHRWEMKVKGA